MLKNPVEYERDISSTTFISTSRQVSTDLLVGVSAGIFQGALVE
jgi:hypothetical protein